MPNWRPSPEAPLVNKIRALIFDMDGVIDESNPHHLTHIHI